MHTPVLVNQIIEASKVAHLNQAKVIDATLGAGGHSIEFCKLGAEVLGIDADQQMLLIAQKRLEVACPGHFKLSHGNFTQLNSIARKSGFSDLDVVLFDLGISTLHYIEFDRGFSFDKPQQSLDMRLDPTTQAVTASDLLNALDQKQLLSLFQTVFDYSQAKRLADKVIAAREQKRFEKVQDLVDLTSQKQKLFLALRIGVNSELDNIPAALGQAYELLKDGGRLLVISFHSMEDRVVKRALLDLVEEKKAILVTKKPVEADEEEIRQNPKARSAKLWILEKRH